MEFEWIATILYNRVCLIADRIVQPSVLTLLVGQQEGHPAYKKNFYCWYAGDDDLIGALHRLTELGLSPHYHPSSVAAMKSRTV